MKPVAVGRTLSEALATHGIRVVNVQVPPAGKVLVSPKGTKYYALATHVSNGVAITEYLLPKAGGRPALAPLVAVAQALLLRLMRQNYPCQRCGGSGMWSGRFKAVCFACGGDGLHRKFFDARWALPTTY